MAIYTKTFGMKIYLNSVNFRDEIKIELLPFIFVENTSYYRFLITYAAGEH